MTLSRMRLSIKMIRNRGCPSSDTNTISPHEAGAGMNGESGEPSPAQQPSEEGGDESRETTGSGNQPLPPVDSRVLLGTASERLIMHQGEVYRLRQTRSGKLILYK